MIARKSTSTMVLLVLLSTLIVPVQLGHATSAAAVQTGDFSLSFFNNPQTVKRGSGTLFEIEITPEGGFSGTVHLTFSASLPKGINCGLAPQDVQVSGTATQFPSFDCDVPKPVATAPTGTFDILVTATSGTITHTETAILIVR